VPLGLVEKKFVGKKAVVLIEGDVKDNPCLSEGLTDNYLKVKLPLKQGVGSNRSDPGSKNKLVLE